MKRKRWLMFLLVLALLLPSCALVNAEEAADEAADQPPSDLPFVTFDWYLGLTPMQDNQMVNDALNEKLLKDLNANVNLHFWTAPEWEEKMTTMISSGQDVGIVGFGSQSKLDYVVQSNRGAFYPLEDLLDQYGPGTKALFDQEIWDCMTINGHIYGIPSLKDNCYIISMVYNATMADALGLDMSQIKHTNWRDNEAFLNEVLEKRNEMFPEYAGTHLSSGAELEMPYNFAVESFLNDSFMAVCNIEGIMDIEGYDTETVFNLYSTPEYREFCKSRQRMVEKNIFAYDYEGKDENNYDGSMFSWVGWGYTYMQEHLYGDAFVTKMIEPEYVWTDTNNYFSAGSAISANCANPERAMMFLELINTDSSYATMMRFGVEGQHYVRDAEGKMVFEGSERNGGAREDYGYFYWYAAPVGNLTIVEAPESLTGPDGIMLTKMNEYNEKSIKPSHMGFVFNVEPVSNEIAACTNVVMEYRDLLRKGQLEDEAAVDAAVDDMNAKLTANGIDTIIAEVQKQIDEWKASK